MANEPSLSELSNMRVDADLGGGAPAVVYDNKDLYRRLDNSMQQIAINKKEKYNQFLGNLKDIYKGIGNAADLDVMTNDRPVLQKKMADIFQKIQQDPHKYLGGVGINELNADLAQLKSDSTESAKNNLFDKSHREFLARDPDLNTPENKAKLEAFTNQPLGSRKAYELDTPGLFDPQALAKGIAATTKQDFAETKLSDDGKFINSYSGTKYDPDQWKTVASNLYDLPDPRNGSLRNTIQQRYNSLPDVLKKKFANEEDPAKAYYLDMMDVFRPKDQVKKSGEKSNPYELLNIKDTFTKNRDATKQGYAKDNIELRAKLGVTDLGGNTEYLIRQHSSLSDGSNGRKITVTLNGKQETGEEISAPDFTKKIEDYVSTTTREGTALDPVAQTVVSKGTPDKTILMNDGSVQAIWYKKDSEGHITSDKFESIKKIPRRTWLTIESSNIPQKMRAASINGADAYFQKHKNVSEEMKRIAAGGDPQDEKKQEKNTTPANSKTFNIKDPSTYQGRQKFSDGNYYYKGLDNKWRDAKGKIVDL